jgi:cytochrome c-type biogenesis protein CcmH
MLVFQLRSRGAPGKPDIRTGKAGLGDIEALLEHGKINDAEADAERRAVLSRLWSSNRELPQDRRASRTVVAPAVAFLLVACVGGAITSMEDALEGVASRAASPASLPESGSDGETLAQLDAYTRSLQTEDPASEPATDKLLPDVSTMIERLAARLETAPQDVNGWRMLGWSYFQTARYEQAATAYARAVALDPGSAELRQSYEAAKAKASESNSLTTASPSQTGSVGNGGDPRAETTTMAAAMPPNENSAAIRSMVDGLASRLDRSPRDVDGWTRLMRSRVVLGEKEVATAAFRKALEVFKDDSAASSTISAAALELGLKAE